MHGVTGLTFAWSTLRGQTLVMVGMTTPDETSEAIKLSPDLFSRRMPENKLQETRNEKLLHRNLVPSA
jgi:hypothetical protein